LQHHYSLSEIFQQVSTVENQVKRRKAFEKCDTCNASTKVKKEEEKPHQGNSSKSSHSSSSKDFKNSSS